MFVSVTDNRKPVVKSTLGLSTIGTFFIVGLSNPNPELYLIIGLSHDIGRTMCMRIGGGDDTHGTVVNLDNTQTIQIVSVDVSYSNI